jgi:hypothetical protein
MYQGVTILCVEMYTKMQNVNLSILESIIKFSECYNSMYNGGCLFQCIRYRSLRLKHYCFFVDDVRRNNADLRIIFRNLRVCKNVYDTCKMLSFTSASPDGKHFCPVNESHTTLKWRDLISSLYEQGYNMTHVNR